jgi:hypothetical protein
MEWYEDKLPWRVHRAMRFTMMASSSYNNTLLLSNFPAVMLYLPSTVAPVPTAKNCPFTLSEATLWGLVRRNFWCDACHLRGQSAQALHPNCIEFLKELVGEVGSLSKAKVDHSELLCLTFLKEAYKDVLDAVRLNF